MQPPLLCYTRCVPQVNSLRGAWMKVFKNLPSHAKASQEIRRWQVVIALVLAILAGMAITANAQAPATTPAPGPKKTIIRAGRVLNVRTGELKANQAIVIEGDKIARISLSSEVTAAAGDATIDLPDAT